MSRNDTFLDPLSSGSRNIHYGEPVNLSRKFLGRFPKGHISHTSRHVEFHNSPINFLGRSKLYNVQDKSTSTIRIKSTSTIDVQDRINSTSTIRRNRVGIVYYLYATRFQPKGPSHGLRSDRCQLFT